MGRNLMGLQEQQCSYPFLWKSTQVMCSLYVDPVNRGLGPNYKEKAQQGARNKLHDAWTELANTTKMKPLFVRSRRKQCGIEQHSIGMHKSYTQFITRGSWHVKTRAQHSSAKTPHQSTSGAPKEGAPWYRAPKIQSTKAPAWWGGASRWPRSTLCFPWGRASSTCPQASIQPGRPRLGSPGRTATPDETLKGCVSFIF